ncbi:hypothetical protein PENTCL1PPCAC_6721, partial [Pristionchus entomophagus]
EMARRKCLESRLSAARTVRNIMGRCESLQMNQSKLRALCALLYSIASEEPKAAFRHKIFEVRKCDDNEREEEKSDHSIIVDCLSDLVMMALGVLIERISDEEPSARRPEERNTPAGNRLRKEVLEIERMILSEEEIKERDLEERKRVEGMLPLEVREKERIRKARSRQKQKEELKRLHEERRKKMEEEEERGWDDMNDEKGETRSNGMKTEPLDDEDQLMNPTRKYLIC